MAFYTLKYWPGLGKTTSIVLGNHREQCACASRVTGHPLTHATIIATWGYAHYLNEQQTNLDPTTPLRRRIRQQTDVMQNNDVDRFSMTWLIYNI